MDSDTGDSVERKQSIFKDPVSKWIDVDPKVETTYTDF